ncbi:MAG TPA: hypothetical protein VGR20_07295 [Acidimicrobiia bacterium]|nr:hypothetical protein [Acidimicrobiia bacterium]
MPVSQDPGFVVEWQLAEGGATGEAHRVIDLSTDRRESEVILPADVGMRTGSGA